MHEVKADESANGATGVNGQGQAHANAATAAAPYPLSGIRVLDFTHVLAGPFCSLILAQLGADVVRIERPGAKDLSSTLGVPRVDRFGRTSNTETIHLGRNKRSIALDLTCEAGRETLKRLVKVSDVLTENFRPTTMDKLGVGYSVLREVNPRLIYACVSGFGHKEILPSPYENRPAFNMIAQAMSGILEINGYADAPPCPVPVALGDFIPALYAAIGVLAALEHRNRTNLGQLVDVAMYDSLIPLTVRQTMKYALTGQIQQRGAEMFNSILGIFKASDGYVAITILGQASWERMCELIGRPDLASREDLQADRQRGHAYDRVIRPVLEEWASDKTKHEATEIFLANNLTAGPVQNVKDVFEDPHVAARNMLVEVGDMGGGTVKVPALPVKFSRVGDVPPTEAPSLGEHTVEVLREYLDLNDDEVAELERAGAIR